MFYSPNISVERVSRLEIDSALVQLGTHVRHGARVRSRVQTLFAIERHIHVS